LASLFIIRYQLIKTQAGHTYKVYDDDGHGCFECFSLLTQRKKFILKNQNFMTKQLFPQD